MDPRLGGEVGRDVNRDGNPAGSKGTFGVLWNTTTNDVYVDADQDDSFADEKAMTDYAVRNDVGTFGADNPATGIRESMPFVVQTDGKNKVVNIGIVSGAHGTHIAGIAANRMFGGAMTGAAAGAKLKCVRVCMFATGCTSQALIEGMTWVAKQGNVDDRQQRSRREHHRRPVRRAKVMSVRSYITRETWQKNYGSDASYADNLHPSSSRGPREDGGFKPQIVAPGSAVSTVPTWQRADRSPGPTPFRPVTRCSTGRRGVE